MKTADMFCLRCSRRLSDACETCGEFSNYKLGAFDARLYDQFSRRRKLVYLVDALMPQEAEHEG